MASNVESAKEPTKVEASTTTTIVLQTATAKAAGVASSEPVTFKIVRVRNPDGKIVRVRRPVTAGEVNRPTSEASPPKTASEASSLKTTSQPTVPAAATSVKGAETVPISDAPKVHPQAKENKPNEIQKLSSKEAAAKAPPQVSPDAKVIEPNKILKPSSKEDAAKPPPKDSVKNPAGATSPDNAIRVASGFRLARGFFRFGRGVTQTVAALDPDWDLGDVDELQEGDEYVDDDDGGDNDDGNDENDGNNGDNDGNGGNNDHNGDNNDNNNNDNCGGGESNQNNNDTHQTQVTNPNSTGLEGQHSSDTEKNASGGSGIPVQNGSHNSAVAAAAARNITSNITTKPKSSNVKVNTQKVPAPRRRDVKSDITEQINEKETNSSNDLKATKAHAKYGRSLQGFSLSRIIVWSITIILPILFIVLGIMTVSLNSVYNQDAKALAIRQAIKVGVTSWPIVFAAIVAQSLKTLATYRVEKGIRLMTLEQLINSHSFASAIKQPFLLRRLDFVSIALLCLWGLSPLASQAMQRMSYDTAGYTTISDNVTYVDTTSYINPAFGIYSHQVTSTSLLTDLNALYSAAFLPPSLYQTPDADTWGYPKIPVLEDFVSSGDGWYQPPQDLTHVNYTSLFGIPIQQFGDAGARVFNLTSAHYKFSCPPLRQSSMEDIAPEGNSSFSKSPSGTLLVRLGSNNTVTETGTVGIQLNSYNLTFASRILNAGDSPDVDLFANTVCTFYQALVVSVMECISDGPESFACSVLRMAPLPVPSDGNQGVLQDFSQYWLNAGNFDNYTRTLTERYLNDPSPRTGNADMNMNLTEVPAGEFTQRLSVLFNSYSQIGFAPMFQAGNFTRNSSNTYAYATNSFVPLKVVTSNFTNSTEMVCKTDWVWLSILFICSVFLLLAGIASAVWEWQTVGPDILSFVNTIVRHSKYIVLPKGSGAMSSAERAKMLKSVKVMMQNVKPDEEVGKIALGTMSEDSRRLEKGKLYN